jgi:tetratricopeptide (TPR) repeat protein
VRTRSIVYEARAIGHGPELAEALLSLCRVYDNINEQTAALPVCAEAELVATRSRMDVIAARASAMRVELLAFAGNDTAEFDAAVAAARAWVERDGDLLSELSLEQGLGIARTTAGKHDEAIEHIHRAAQIAVQIGNEDSSTVQTLWNNEAFELTLLGRYDDALALQEKAIAALENPVRDTDLLAHLLDNYGYNLVLAGRAAKARAPLERALAMPGLSAFVHGGLLCDLARIDLADGKPADAIARCEDGLARLREAGTVKFNLAINEDPLATAYLAAGRPADALALEKGHVAPHGLIEDLDAQLARIPK